MTVKLWSKEPIDGNKMINRRVGVGCMSGWGCMGGVGGGGC